jgi:hypothetical protein
MGPIPHSSKSNVRPFPSKRASSSESSESWPARILAASAYLILGFLFRSNPENGLSVLMILGLLYWAFIHHRRLQTEYFTRLHMLQAFMLFFFLFLVSRLSIALVKTVLSLMGLLDWILPLNLFSLFNIGPFASILAWGFSQLMIGVGLIMGLQALLGKTPRLPVITKQAEQWA